MLFFLSNGFRVIAHDRRGHGRSTQVAAGHDMDYYANDLAAVVAHLDLNNAIHVGHSTGGGEVVHHIARHGESRVSKAAIISAVPLLMVQTPTNPKGLPKKYSTNSRWRSQRTARNSTATWPPAPSTTTTRRASRPKRPERWRQGMMGGAKAHYDGIVAFSQTDFTEDHKKITVPAGDAQRGRSDRPLCGCRAAFSKTPKERHAEDL